MIYRMTRFWDGSGERRSGMRGDQEEKESEKYNLTEVIRHK